MVLDSRFKHQYQYTKMQSGLFIMHYMCYDNYKCNFYSHLTF